MDERQDLLNVLDSLENAFDDDPFTPAEGATPNPQDDPLPDEASADAPASAGKVPADDVETAAAETDVEITPLVRAAIGDDFAPTRRKHQDSAPDRSGFVPIRMSTAAYLEHLYRMENL